MSMVPPDQQPVFTMTPDKIVLEPKGSGTFVINGLALRQGEAREQMVCVAASGSQSKSSRKVDAERRRNTLVYPDLMCIDLVYPDQISCTPICLRCM